MSSFVIVPPNKPTFDPGIDPSDSNVWGIDMTPHMDTGDAATGTPTVSVSAGSVGPASFSGSTVQARVSGCPLGVTVRVRFTWQTVGGDTINRSIYLPVKAL